MLVSKKPSDEAEDLKLPELSKSAQTMFLDGFCRSTTYLYPAGSIQVERPFDVVEEPVEIQKAKDAMAKRGYQEDDKNPKKGSSAHEWDANEDDDGLQEGFWERNRAMNRISSSTEAYEECCLDLGLDPQSPTHVNYTLEVHQVAGVWWILYMLKYGLGSAVLGDDVGLGKTLVSLIAIRIGVDLAKNPIAGRKYDLGLTGSYKNTLVLCPPQAFDVWKYELRAIGMNVKLWASDMGKVTGEDKDMTIGKKIADLREEVDRFDEHDPETAANVVLCTLPTWQKRTYVNGEAPKSQKPQDDDDDDEDEDDYNDEDDLDLKPITKATKGQYKAVAVGFFGLVFIDEAHLVKTPNTLLHQSIMAAKFQKLVLVTATIAINKTRDIGGVLALVMHHFRRDLLSVLPPAKQRNFLDVEMYEDEEEDKPDDDDDDDDDPLTLEDFEAEYQRIIEAKSTIVDFEWDRILKFLDPKTFRRLVPLDQDNDGSMRASSIVLPVILSYIQLRRVKGQKIEAHGKEQIIGAEIPRFIVTTVELEQSYEEAVLYLNVSLEAIEERRRAKFKRGEISNELKETLDLQMQRKLCIAALHPELSSILFQKKKHETDRLTLTPGKHGKKKKAKKIAMDFQQEHQAKLKDIDKLHDRGDHGWSVWYHNLHPSQSLMAARDRIFAANNVAANSVKIKAMADLINKICYTQGENLVIYFNWPSTQWVGEMFGNLVTVPMMSIRASHTKAQRQATVDAFNDKKTRGTVLFTNTLTSATSMNLQHNCHNMIIMEPIPSAQRADQVIGRLHRMGQKFIQNIYILTTRFTIDGHIMARAARKAMMTLGGMCGIGVSDEDIEAAEKELREGELEGTWADLSGERQKSAAIQRAYLHKVKDIYRDAYGQRMYVFQWKGPDAPFDFGDAEETAKQPIKRSYTNALRVESLLMDYSFPYYHQTVQEVRRGSWT